jgi:hypothetical protein
MLRNREFVAYGLAFAGNTWEVFSIRVWFVACLSWTLSLPNNALSLPVLGVATCLALAATRGRPIWIVLPLVILVQITSFAMSARLPGA